MKRLTMSQLYKTHKADLSETALIIVITTEYLDLTDFWISFPF